MKEAINEAIYGSKNNFGGPFGAVITLNGKIIAKSHNKVLKTNDPTSHAEINAIRIASGKLNRFNLSDCEIYSTCEPCPMCLSAIYWAKIKKVYFGCTRIDAEKIGFDDNFIYNALNGKNNNRIKLIQQNHKDCLEIFSNWYKNPYKKIY